MADNESVKFFLRFLDERFKVFREVLTRMLRTMCLEDRTKKVEATQELLVSLDDLKRALSANDRPPWIAPLEQRLNWYLSHNQTSADAGLTVLSTILQLYGQIESQKWQFDEAATAGAIDFNAIYQEYYKSSRVPQLFDELVVHLEDILKSGQIDSIQAIQALQKLIATIRKNARGDYFATRGTWEFTQVFFRNLFVEVLENIPGLKHFVKALRKTMSELDLEMAELHEHIREKLDHQLGEVHQRIRQRILDSSTDDIAVLDYKPLSLPPPSEPDQPPTTPPNDAGKIPQ